MSTRTEQGEDGTCGRVLHSGKPCGRPTGHRGQHASDPHHADPYELAREPAPDEPASRPGPARLAARFRF